MARVELPGTILAIHGRLGNLIYRSRKQPDGTYRVFVHPATEPRKRKKSNGAPENFTFLGRASSSEEPMPQSGSQSPNLLHATSSQHRDNIEPTSRDNA